MARSRSSTSGNWHLRKRTSVSRRWWSSVEDLGLSSRINTPFVVTRGARSLEYTTCVQTLGGHSQNRVVWPFITNCRSFLVSPKIARWSHGISNTQPLKFTLNYGLDRNWSISCLRDSKNVALAYDEGTIMIKVRNSFSIWTQDFPFSLQLTREETAE